MNFFWHIFVNFNVKIIFINKMLHSNTVVYETLSKLILILKINIKLEWIAVFA